MNLPPTIVEIPFYLFCVYAYQLPTTHALWVVGSGLYEFLSSPFSISAHMPCSAIHLLIFLGFGPISEDIIQPCRNSHSTPTCRVFRTNQ
ncbi:hypothetical protein BJV78DRAFT_693183 [Lactifluus subvellereus]|nr:hypothetical protein BJV78DRAFT_693183 [Lactifluus subvellereus]